MIFFCSKCGYSDDVDVAVLRKRERAGLGVQCPKCSSPMGKSLVPVYRNENIRTSRAQETRVARREGARRQAASGSRPGYEGDVRSVGKYRGECKFTKARSYTLKVEDLKKLEMQANYGELPVFDIEFRCDPQPRRYVVLPEWVYEMLMRDAGRRGDHAQPVPAPDTRGP